MGGGGVATWISEASGEAAKRFDSGHSRYMCLEVSIRALMVVIVLQPGEGRRSRLGGSESHYVTTPFHFSKPFAAAPALAPTETKRVIPETRQRGETMTGIETATWKREICAVK